MKLKFTHQDLISLEMTIEIDMDKFKLVAEEINKFWGDHEYRFDKYESHEKAALNMFAAECFQLVAFNNFLDGKYATDKFDWKQKRGGVEGWYSLEDMGIEILDLESWHIEHEQISYEEITNKKADQCSK